MECVTICLFLRIGSVSRIAARSAYTSIFLYSSRKLCVCHVNKPKELPLYAHFRILELGD